MVALDYNSSITSSPIYPTSQMQIGYFCRDEDIRHLLDEMAVSPNVTTYNIGSYHYVTATPTETSKELTYLSSDIYNRISYSNYLTENFNLEKGSLSKIIDFMINNRVQISLLEEYRNEAVHYMNIDRIILTLDDTEKDNYMLVTFVLNCHGVIADSQFTDYITNFLTHKHPEKDKINISIR